MNIGIDARLLERNMTGIGRFLNTFLQELPFIDSQNRYYLFSYGKLKLDNEFYNIIPTIKSFLPQKVFSPFWINFILPWYLKKNKIDIFFSVNQLLPIVKINYTKYVLVLHDVIYKIDKTFHPFIYRKYLQFFTYFSIKSSDIIITVSQYSKQDILKYYKVDENKVKVIYEAADKNFGVLKILDHEREEIRAKFNLPERIVLYVGMIENRKNITCILKIADEVYSKYQDIKFVLIGKIGYGGEKLVGEIQKRKNVVHLKYVDDDVLKKIYNISFIFLYPSFYEGFGFPPLEAMQCGLPVLASDNTSLRELIESAGLLHDANDYLSFTEDIYKLIEDIDFYQRIRNLGLERAKYFNIKNTISEVVNTFNSFQIK
jgi:glycosyltransferase involved in cell wall biosynthesis